MNTTSKRASVAAVAAVGMLGLLSTTARADGVDPDKPVRTYTEERVNPVTGETETATITEYPDVIKRGDGPSPDARSRASSNDAVSEGRPGGVDRSAAPAGTLQPAAGTGGLYLRDVAGAIKGLMGEGDRARIIACHPSNPNLVEAEQITSGHKGWGVYRGYVKISATAEPGRIAC
ncbi:hypothetical protein ACIQNI_30495 [Streptomyces sp. NPDC091266]|uniref:hypothetical protein n=1 Tax=Streptomyces sp. NPDC091266 TaxID=3365978 RepID=UPI00381AB63B